MSFVSPFLTSKRAFQCWKSGLWRSWGYSGLQHEHFVGARSCESSPGFCAMEITPRLPWCLNNMLWEDKTGLWKGTKSDCPADTSHCTWLNRLPVGKWLLALPETCSRAEAAEKETLCRQWPSEEVECLLRSVSHVPKQLFGWEAVDREWDNGTEGGLGGRRSHLFFIAMCLLFSTSLLPNLGCYSRGFLVWENLFSGFPLSHWEAAVGSDLFFAELFSLWLSPTVLLFPALSCVLQQKLLICSSSLLSKGQDSLSSGLC